MLEIRTITVACVLVVLGKSIVQPVRMEEAIVYVVLTIVVGAYWIAQLYFSAIKEIEVLPELNDEIAKDVEELKSRVNALNLKEGLKIK